MGESVRLRRLLRALVLALWFWYPDLNLCYVTEMRSLGRLSNWTARRKSNSECGMHNAESNGFC